MADENYADLLKQVIDRIVSENREMKPGTPFAELQEAVDAALTELPPLQFEEFDQAIADRQSIQRFLQRAPELIGWDADLLVEWIEELSKKV